MAGDPTKAEIWTNADVYIGDDTAVDPTDIDTAWGTGWEAVGLLDGEEGFNWAREEDVTDHYAWGSILVTTTRSKHKRTVRFIALEDNDTVFDLVNPGSTRATVSGLTTSTVKVPSKREFKIGFELRDGTKVKRRTTQRAQVTEVGEIKESESELTVYELTVTLYPESDGTLYVELAGEPTP